MTFAQHGVMSGLIAHYAGCPWEVSVGIGIVGTLPDVLAMPETIHGDYSDLYQKYHSWSDNWLAWLPPATFTSGAVVTANVAVPEIVMRRH